MTVAAYKRFAKATPKDVDATDEANLGKNLFD